MKVSLLIDVTIKTELPEGKFTQDDVNTAVKMFMQDLCEGIGASPVAAKVALTDAEMKRIVDDPNATTEVAPKDAVIH